MSEGGLKGKGVVKSDLLDYWIVLQEGGELAKGASLF